MTTASACAKAILFGEHAVVYGRPAVAVPVIDLRALAEINTALPGAGITFHALDLQRDVRLSDSPDALARPLQETTLNVLHSFGVVVGAMSLDITLRSRVPVARGLGSGASVATALTRALARHANQWLEPAQVSALVYRTEVILHGTPSGIDNTVISYERPVHYQGGALSLLSTGEPLHLLVADSGTPSLTRDMVTQVREARSARPHEHEALFDHIGLLAEAGQRALENGDVITLGGLLTENHALLRELGVSTLRLDELTQVATGAGALGAKLVGGGGGGCIVALAFEDDVEAVRQALETAHAVVYYTVVE